ncbi:leader peptidase (prepilin peptidase)/N-methyltransferase [Okibacterium sp. HSC-33S16]|uniref:prepilin peptidase n=1 Tax=Okibacterium sp. HSC-33S16 TaxID=2910965 RepID=UPI00209CBCFE|nr:prepilin peptidase [Okibacterium sp. HSC-33S16]MCP2030320.1 leader peptidase (prepilin peptidase)/N-methyltransferase [Okibacterium sp. HSC-33S16]
MILAGDRDTARSTRARDLVALLAMAGVLGAIGVLAVGVRPLAIAVVAIAAVTETLVRGDIERHRLPNRLVLPLYPIVALSVGADAVVLGREPLSALTAGAGWFAFLLVLCVAGGLGMGDVKLGGVLGLCLGSLGLAAAGAGLVIAFGTGAIAGLIVLVRPGGGVADARRRRRIPFGPFLLAGFWITVVCFPVLTGSTA